MARNVSTTFRQAATAPTTEEVFLMLLEIDHPTLGSPIRVVNNNESITSNSNTYLPFHFEVALPDDREDTINEVDLRIDNVDRQIVTAIRQINSPADVTLQVVLASTPNTVEAGPYTFTMRNVQWDARFVTGKLVFSDDPLNTRFPDGTFTPGDFPALFS